MIRMPQKIKLINLEDINPNPYQTRRNFNGKSLEKLAESIKEVGMLSPVIVRPAAGGYELICGQRRLRAAGLAGFKHIPAIVVLAGDRQCALLSMTENLQRENLTLFEEAEGYYNLMSYHKVKKDELSANLSVESGRINEKVRLLSLSPSVRYKMEENLISEKAARTLLKIHDAEKQAELLQIIINEELNQKETENLVKDTLREMSRGERESKRGKKKTVNMPLCINTVKKTVDLLKKSGAKVEVEQKDNEKYIEFTFKIHK